MKKFLGIIFLILLFGGIIGGCWWFLATGAEKIEEKLLAGLSDNVTTPISDSILTNESSGYSAIGVDKNRAKDYFTEGAASSKLDLEKLYVKCSGIFETAKYEFEPIIYANLVVKSPDNKKMTIKGTITFDDAVVNGLQFEWYTNETIFRAYPGGAFYSGKDKYFLKVKDLSITNESNLLIKVKKESKEYFYDCAYAYASSDKPDNASKVAIQNISTHLYTDLFYVAEVGGTSNAEGTLYKLDTTFLDKVISCVDPETGEDFFLENNGSAEVTINNIYKNYYDVSYEDEGANDILGYMAIRYTFFNKSTASSKNYYILLHATDVTENDTMLVGVYDDDYNCLYYADDKGLKYQDNSIEIKLDGYALKSSKMCFVKNVKKFEKYIGLYMSTKIEPFGDFDLADDFYYGVNHGSNVDLFYKSEDERK